MPLSHLGYLNINKLSNKSLYQIALTCIKGVGVAHARNLIEIMGDEESVFKGDIADLLSIPGISRRLVNEIRDLEVLRRAEKELNFIEKNNLDFHFFTNNSYPQRLTNCIDAPIVLYSKGKTDFNHDKVISIVGTRNSTRYGHDFCNDFIEDISHRIPNLQIVSGLAYGVDICAHKAAIKNNLSTIAVLAHGLDRIYPFPHRQTAIEMLENGALLTEFKSNTNPDKHNFVKRNRIVAGMSDAVIVVESPLKGGSLITADIANSYFREVFALPGRFKDKMSAGCNKLISDNKAVLLESTDHFITNMGWGVDTIEVNKPRQNELFQELSTEEEKIVNVLHQNDTMHVNALSIELNISVKELFMTLLELEMKKIIEALPGGNYQLV
jgi:DNA processing protein